LDAAIPESHQAQLRMILRAIAELIHGEGDIDYVQKQVYDKWQKNKEMGKGVDFFDEELGFDRDSFHVAKELFMKSELYRDLTVANSISGMNQKTPGGLSMNHRIHFVNQFMDILDPDGAFKEGHGSFSQGQLEGPETVRVMGEHKALQLGDMTMYQALKNNKLREAQIMEFLIDDDGAACDKDKQEKEGSSLSKYMSESVRSELSHFENNLFFDQEAKEYKKLNHQDGKFKM
jgi:hypothetical protein